MGDREDTEALTGEIETLLENELRYGLPADPSWLAVWVMDLVKPHVRARVAEALAPIEALADEHERMVTPAPYTTERALIERLRAALPAPDPERTT